MNSILKLFMTAFLFCGIAAHAQPFPNRPVTLVIGFPPGQSTDIVGRLVGQKLSELWSQPVVIDNRTGAGGNIAAGFVARSPADGYTIFLGNNGVAISDTLHPNMNYKLFQDLRGITKLASQPFVLVVPPSLPANSVKELIALAKAKPKQLNFGSGGIGNADHLAAELFVHMAGIEMTHIPYRGNPSVGLLAGDITMFVGGLAAALPLIKSGKMKALAVSGRERSTALPDVPTMAEAGLKGYDITLWNGLLVPAGTPQDVVDRLAIDTARVLRAPDVQDKFEAQGLRPTPIPPAEFQASLREEAGKWETVIKSIGLKVE